MVPAEPLDRLKATDVHARRGRSAAASCLLPRRAIPVVRFLGNSEAYWRLLIRGAVLLMFTLGIYRFWLATDIRRFLWSNTELAGDSFEYSGTARELLHRIPDRAHDRHSALLFVLLRRAGRRNARRYLGPAQLRAADVARPLRGLPRAALSPHPHDLSRRAFPPDRLGLALRRLRAVLVDLDRSVARPCLSVRAIAARAVQDAPHLLRRPARPL